MIPSWVFPKLGCPDFLYLFMLESNQSFRVALCPAAAACGSLSAYTPRQHCQLRSSISWQSQWVQAMLKLLVCRQTSMHSLPKGTWAQALGKNGPESSRVWLDHCVKGLSCWGTNSFLPGRENSGTSLHPGSLLRQLDSWVHSLVADLFTRQQLHLNTLVLKIMWTF